MDKGKQITDNFENVISITKAWLGKELHVNVELTNRNFDRHATTYSIFTFILKDVRGRISGGRIMFSGETELVEIGVDCTTEVEKGGKRLILTEQIRDSNHGHTELKRRLILELTNETAQLPQV